MLIVSDRLVVLSDGATSNLAADPLASELGRKATTLHALASGELPVPKALAIPHQLAARIESGDPGARTLATEAAAQIGYPLAVRSSASIEDLENAAAPGLFESVLDVENEEQLFQAIERVLDSGRTQLVGCYLQARGIQQAPAIAVILQQQVMASRAQGVLYTRPPGQPTSTVAILELPEHHPAWIDRETSRVQLPNDFGLSESQAITLWKLACRAEQVLGGSGGLDIEWVWDEAGPHLVQARPVIHRTDLQTAGSPEVRALIAFSRGDQSRLWRLDATHNPFPLSPAQAGLVEQVRDLAPYDMRVVGGYLYTAKRPSAAPPALSRADVHQLYHSTWFPKMDAALRAVEEEEHPSLARALDAYRKVFRCYTEELSPAIAAAGGSDGGANPLSSWLARARRGVITLEELMDSVAPIAPAWDVSVPTYGETPELVERALELSPVDEGAEASAEESLSESDDMLFYRAQTLVRRALLLLASRWGVGDAIFFMPFERLLAEEAVDPVPGDLLPLASEAQRTHRQQRAVEMPLAFANGEPLPSRLPPDGEIWLGLGTGSYARGTVVRVEQLRDFPRIRPEDRTVLVMPTVSPAHALAARGAVAVVCEYGEHLGHGAAMARELNIPCVVGCRRAWRELRTGDEVAVHGQAGLVARLGPSTPKSKC